MAIFIDDEAIRGLQSPLDIEKFGERFKTENAYYSFPDPNLLAVDKNLYYLLRHSEEVPFEAKYRYRPDYMSDDYYGTPILWELLMYVNNVFSLEDFDLETVIVPSLDAIIFTIQDQYPTKDVDDLKAIEW
jgi:hypothetical protein